MVKASSASAGQLWLQDHQCFDLRPRWAVDAPEWALLWRAGDPAAAGPRVGSRSFSGLLPAAAAGSELEQDSVPSAEWCSYPDDAGLRGTHYTEGESARDLRHRHWSGGGADRIYRSPDRGCEPAFCSHPDQPRGTPCAW